MKANFMRVLHIQKHVKRNVSICISNTKKALAFLKRKSEENINIGNKPFRVFICVGNCAVCNNKIYYISRYNCRTGKKKAWKHS